MVWVLRFAVLYCTAIGCGLCYDVLCCAVPCFICDMVLCSEVCLDVTWRMMYCAMYILYTGDMWCSIVRCVDMWYVTRCLCVLCYDFLIRDMLCCDVPCFACDGVLCGEVRWYVTKWRVMYDGMFIVECWNVAWCALLFFVVVWCNSLFSYMLDYSGFVWSVVVCGEISSFIT